MCPEMEPNQFGYMNSNPPRGWRISDIRSQQILINPQQDSAIHECQTKQEMPNGN